MYRGFPSSTLRRAYSRYTPEPKSVMSEIIDEMIDASSPSRGSRRNNSAELLAEWPTGSSLARNSRAADDNTRRPRVNTAQLRTAKAAFACYTDRFSIRRNEQLGDRCDFLIDSITACFLPRRRNQSR